MSDITAGAADKRPRANPGPMRVFICAPVTYRDGIPQITVFAEAKSASEKDVREAVTGLGHGDYTQITCRFTPRKFHPVTRDSFA